MKKFRLTFITILTEEMEVPSEEGSLIEERVLFTDPTGLCFSCNMSQEHLRQFLQLLFEQAPERVMRMLSSAFETLAREKAAEEQKKESALASEPKPDSPAPDCSQSEVQDAPQRSPNLTR